MNILKQSFLFKIISAVSFCAKHSALARFCRYMSKQYERSRFCAIIRRFCSVPDRIGSSMYGIFSDYLAVWWEDLCALLAFAWKNSVIGRLCAAIYRGMCNSRLIGRLCRIGFRRLSVTALALYLPIDYFLREILGIGILASVWDEALLLVLFAYVLFERGFRPEIYAERSTTLGAFIALFLSVGFFLMCAVSPSFSIAVSGYRAVVQYMLWYFVIIRLFSERGDFMLFYYTMIVMSLLMCLHGIYQFIIAAPIPSSWVSSTEQGVRTRIFSITGSPNIMGSFIVMTAPLVAGLLYYYKKLKHKLAALCVLGLMCGAVLFTFSKGAWFGAAIAIVIFAVLVDGRLIGLMFAGGAAALVAMPSVVGRIKYIFTSEYTVASMAGGRMIRWQTGLDLLNSSNPLLGFGLGRFGGAVAMQNQVLDTSNGFSYFYMDNYYLKTLVEMGWLGLIAYIILLVAAVVWMLRALYKLKGTSDYPLVCGIFAGLCGVLAHCYFENIFEVPYMSAYFWMLAAAIIFRGYFCPSRSVSGMPEVR